MENRYAAIQEVEVAVWKLVGDAAAQDRNGRKMKQGLPLTFLSLFWYALLEITSIYFVSIKIGVNYGGSSSSLTGCAETDFS